MHIHLAVVHQKIQSIQLLCSIIVELLEIKCWFWHPLSTADIKVHLTAGVLYTKLLLSMSSYLKLSTLYYWKPTSLAYHMYFKKNWTILSTSVYSFDTFNYCNRKLYYWRATSFYALMVQPRFLKGKELSRFIFMHSHSFCCVVPWTQLYLWCCLRIMHLYLQDFQEGPGAQIFLLTTQVGGLGLTLTKAARVIVVDPAWNPRYPNSGTSWSNIFLSNYLLLYTIFVLQYGQSKCGSCLSNRADQRCDCIPLDDIWNNRRKDI
jgi:hypothetical protein